MLLRTYGVKKTNKEMRQSAAHAQAHLLCDLMAFVSLKTVINLEKKEKKKKNSQRTHRTWMNPINNVTGI